LEIWPYAPRRNCAAQKARQPPLDVDEALEDELPDDEELDVELEDDEDEVMPQPTAVSSHAHGTQAEPAGSM